jgi:quercetin dioxygenase-like cupin family protein
MEMYMISLLPLQKIAMERHLGITQLFQVYSGSGYVIIGKQSFAQLKRGDVFIIPAGVQHQVSASDEGLKLVTTYSPPHEN